MSIWNVTKMPRIVFDVKKPFPYLLKLALNSSLSLLVKQLSHLDLIYFFAQINFLHSIILCRCHSIRRSYYQFHLDIFLIFIRYFSAYMYVRTLYTHWIHFNLFGTVIGSFRCNNSQLMFDCNCFVMNERSH